MRKVIFLLLDGARYDCLNKYLSLGYLPNLSKFIDNQGSNLSAISVFPSTTGPAYVPFLMGSYPGNINLPGIRWFDKIKFAENVVSTAVNSPFKLQYSFSINLVLAFSLSTSILSAGL